MEYNKTNIFIAKYSLPATEKSNSGQFTKRCDSCSSYKNRCGVLQNGLCKKVVKYSKRPRNGCDGRSMPITTICANL